MKILSSEDFFIEVIETVECGFFHREVGVSRDGICEDAEDCHIRMCGHNKREIKKPFPFQLGSLSFMAVKRAGTSATIIL